MSACDPFWTVAATKPRQERRAADNLGRQGLEHYLPEIAVPARSGFRREVLFPSYIFVRVVACWASVVRSTRGVSRLLTTSSGGLIPLPDGEIEALKAREKEGFVREKFRRGETVIGPWGSVTLAGVYDGVDDASGRCRVLVTMLSKSFTVMFRECDLSAG